MTIHGARPGDRPNRVAEPRQYDALLVVSYGGPEGPDDVLPFLENATRGRGVPQERLLDVATHYHHFGGVSPINAQNRALVSALASELAAHGVALPIYLGNRNWHPLVGDTVREMADAGVRRALVLVTSAFSSYSGCRQYREDVIRAGDAVGDRAPQFDKVRVFFNHPGFIGANAESLRESLASAGASARDGAHVVFTAHSIPASMARGSAYEAQLHEASGLVASAVGVTRWTIAYQSRSGPPHVAWLGPDICDELRSLVASGVRDVFVLPIGFLSDHIEVRYDLDHEARAIAEELGIHFHRVPTVGTRQSFVSGLRELVLERIAPGTLRKAWGTLGASDDVCPFDCCPDGRSR